MPATQTDEAGAQELDTRSLSTQVQADLMQGMIDVFTAFGDSLADAGIVSRAALTAKLTILVAAQVDAEGLVETPRQYAARALAKFFSQERYPH